MSAVKVNTASTLATRAMLANLHISRWDAPCTDKKVSSEIADAHGVDAKRAGKYRKLRINTEHASYTNMRLTSNELRRTHYLWTMRWSDDGARILPAVSHLKYMAAYREKKAAFEAAIQVFLDAYPQLVRDARKELNGMFNANDYPKDIASRFAVELNVTPLPDARDFRVKLPDEDIREIREGLERETQNMLQKAMKDPYERLFKHVARMVEQLIDKPENTRFHDTLVTGLVELCEILPAFNLTNDKRLDSLIKRARNMVDGVEPEALKHVPTVRSAVAEEARQIHKMMSAFMTKPKKAGEKDDEEDDE